MKPLIGWRADEVDAGKAEARGSVDAVGMRLGDFRPCSGSASRDDAKGRKRRLVDEELKVVVVPAEMGVDGNARGLDGRRDKGSCGGAVVAIDPYRVVGNEDAPRPLRFFDRVAQSLAVVLPTGPGRVVGSNPVKKDKERR